MQIKYTLTQEVFHEDGSTSTAQVTTDKAITLEDMHNLYVDFLYASGFRSVEKYYEED